MRQFLLYLVLSCAKTYRPRASFQSDLLCEFVPSTSSFIFLPSSLAPEHRDSRNAMQCDSTHLLRTLRFLGSLLTFSLLSYQPTIFSLSLSSQSMHTIFCSNVLRPSLLGVCAVASLKAVGKLEKPARARQIFDCRRLPMGTKTKQGCCMRLVSYRPYLPRKITKVRGELDELRRR